MSVRCWSCAHEVFILSTRCSPEQKQDNRLALRTKHPSSVSAQLALYQAILRHTQYNFEKSFSSSTINSFILGVYSLHITLTSLIAFESMGLLCKESIDIGKYL
ncbi:hypothetical protein BDR06DRAFT_396837 [Suillus hirtellus]|nr:hypothetical protein BDR06DRAFT_396837 [Suillus hirtellus]